MAVSFGAEQKRLTKMIVHGKFHGFGMKTLQYLVEANQLDFVKLVLKPANLTRLPPYYNPQGAPACRAAQFSLKQATS